MDRRGETSTGCNEGGSNTRPSDAVACTQCGKLPDMCSILMYVQQTRQRHHQLEAHHLQVTDQTMAPSDGCPPGMSAKRKVVQGGRACRAASPRSLLLQLAEDRPARRSTGNWATNAHEVEARCVPAAHRGGGRCPRQAHTVCVLRAAHVEPQHTACHAVLRQCAWPRVFHKRPADPPFP